MEIILYIVWVDTTVQPLRCIEPNRPNIYTQQQRLRQMVEEPYSTSKVTQDCIDRPQEYTLSKGYIMSKGAALDMMHH